MFRYLLFLLLIYFGWRIIRTIFAIKYRSREPEESTPPFDKIQEAEFEDVTNKPDSELYRDEDKKGEEPSKENQSAG